MAIERIESAGRGKESEPAAVAHDDAGLHRDARRSGSDFDDMVVEHEKLSCRRPAPAFLID
jgi:hypothetical protein